MRPPERMRARARGCGMGLALLASLLVTQALQGQGPRFLRDSTFPRDPIQVLLDRTGELRLTAQQTSHLKKVQAQLRAANDPLVTQLVAIRHQVQRPARPRDMSPEQRETFRAAVQRARPIMQAIGRNNYQAMQRVGSVLTPAQKEQVRGWLQAGTPGFGPRGGGGRGVGPGAGPGPRIHGGR